MPASIAIFMVFIFSSFQNGDTGNVFLLYSTYFTRSGFNYFHSKATRFAGGRLLPRSRRLPHDMKHRLSKNPFPFPNGVLHEEPVLTLNKCMKHHAVNQA
jgi:hypothetical protein